MKGLVEVDQRTLQLCGWSFVKEEVGNQIEAMRRAIAQANWADEAEP